MLLLVGRNRVVSVQPDGTADLLYEAGEGYYVQSAVYGDGVLFAAVYQERNSESTQLVFQIPAVCAFRIPFLINSCK